MKRPPFQMKASRRATLKRDGKFVVGGRASFCWETFLMSRIAGVPGCYEIRLDRKDSPWHQLDWSMDEAEQFFRSVGGLASRTRPNAALITRANRQRRGLPVS